MLLVIRWSRLTLQYDPQEITESAHDIFRKEDEGMRLGVSMKMTRNSSVSFVHAPLKRFSFENSFFLFFLWEMGLVQFLAVTRLRTMYTILSSFSSCTLRVANTADFYRRYLLRHVRTLREFSPGTIKATSRSLFNGFRSKLYPTSPMRRWCGWRILQDKTGMTDFADFCDRTMKESSVFY